MNITQEQLRQFVINSDTFLVKKYKYCSDKYKYSVYFKTMSGYASKAYDGWFIINYIARLLGTNIRQLEHLNYLVYGNHIII